MQPAGRRAHPHRGHRSDPQPRRRAARARGQPAHAVGRLVRGREPPGHQARVPARDGARAASAASTTTRRSSPRRCARCRPSRSRRVDDRRAHARARSTRPTSSTASSRARWASSWSRRPTCSSTATRSSCAPRAARAASHVIYRRIDDAFLDPEFFRPDSMLGVPGPDARLRGRATSRWPTRPATASPTTRRSTRSCPT